MELFERIRYISDIKDVSLAKIAKGLGVPQQTFHQWLKLGSQKNLWEHLPKIMEMFPDIRREWLWWGEGAMLAGEYPPAPEPVIQVSQAVPLIGFASCSTTGWHGTMSIPVAVEPPRWHEGMVAVMASGESMLPAGIGHGQVCYCDTTVAPATGEAVFIEQQDGSGTIKLFLGRSERGDGQAFINLQGWLDKHGDGTAQKPFNLDVAVSFVRRMAPVVYVRRRL